MILRTIINCKKYGILHCFGASLLIHLTGVVAWLDADRAIEITELPQVEAPEVVYVQPPELKIEPKPEPQPKVERKVRAKVVKKRRAKSRARNRKQDSKRAKRRKRVQRRKKAQRRKKNQRHERAQRTPKKSAQVSSVTPKIKPLPKTPVNPSPVAVQEPDTHPQKSAQADVVSETRSVQRQISRSQIKGLLRGYYQSLNTLMRNSKDYPRAARRQRIEGTVLVEMVVDRVGRIIKVRVVRSSGHDVLDKAAVAQVEKMNRVPEIPQELNRPSMTFQIPFEYRLQS